MKKDWGNIKEKDKGKKMGKHKGVDENKNCNQVS